MTEEDFEKEAEDIKELMMHFHLIRDRDEKRKLKKTILYFVHQLLKV